jgi:hypothetical protein
MTETDNTDDLPITRKDLKRWRDSWWAWAAGIGGAVAMIAANLVAWRNSYSEAQAMRTTVTAQEADTKWLLDTVTAGKSERQKNEALLAQTDAQIARILDNMKQNFEKNDFAHSVIIGDLGKLEKSVARLEGIVEGALKNKGVATGNRN